MFLASVRVAVMDRATRRRVTKKFDVAAMGVLK